MICKICRLTNFDVSGSICPHCSIGIEAMELFIEDLWRYLSSADSERLPDYYSNNLPYFVSNLSVYNRYVSVKNLLQEVTMVYLSIGSDEKIFRQDLENAEPLKIEKIEKTLAQNDLISMEYDSSHDDFLIVPMNKVSISTHVLTNFGLEGNGFSNYFNSLLLFSMLILVRDDVTSWINGDEKNFPRKGFFPIRLIAAAVERAMDSKTDSHHLTTEEILRAMKGLTYKSQTKAFSQLIGMDFQSKSIFETIPDPDEDTQTNLTEEFSEMVDHLAERIRERTAERENER